MLVGCPHHYLPALQGSHLVCPCTMPSPSRWLEEVARSSTSNFSPLATSWPGLSQDLWFLAPSTGEHLRGILRTHLTSPTTVGAACMRNNTLTVSLISVLNLICCFLFQMTRHKFQRCEWKTSQGRNKKTVTCSNLEQLKELNCSESEQGRTEMFPTRRTELFKTEELKCSKFNSAPKKFERTKPRLDTLNLWYSKVYSRHTFTFICFFICLFA